MNNPRREQIANIIKQAADAKQVLENLMAEIEQVRDEEQEYYDNMPEGLQGGEKGERASAAIDSLENAACDVESMNDSLDEVISNLEAAKE